MSKKNINEYTKELIEKFPELKGYENYDNVVVSVLGWKNAETESMEQKKLITFYYKEGGKKKRKSFIIYSEKVEEL